MKPKILSPRLTQTLFCLFSAAGLGSTQACTNDEYDAGTWDNTGTTTPGPGSTAPLPNPPRGTDAGVSGSGGLSGAASGGTPAAAAAPPTNPFVATAYDPFSTFAVDVDTASYDIFRRDINLRQLPLASQVRLEEFVNAFSYAYEPPVATAETPFAVGLSAAVSPFASGTTLLRVSVKGKEAAALGKKPINIVYLIDVSGSMMSSDKLPLVKQVASSGLDLLEPTDKVSIVTYSGTTAVALPPTAASQKSAIRAVLASLVAKGGTRGGSGIMLAYQQAEAAFIPRGINHIVLCTDGDFNLGITNTDELVRLIETERKTGVTLTALGFGSDHLNDAMMERVSNAGNGSYAVISSEENAAKYVRDSLFSSIVHIAQDVKLQVEFNPESVLAYRLLGYEDRDIADANFRNDVIDAGEIGAGLSVTALYELTLVGATVPVPAGAPSLKTGTPVGGTREILPGDLAMVKVRYKMPGAAQTDPAREVATHLTADTVVQTLSAADPDLQWAAALGAFAEILKGSPYANRANLSVIEAIVGQQKSRDEGRAEFEALFMKALPLLQR